MKKIIWFMPLLALLFVACGKKDQIDATFASDEYNGQKVYLYQMEKWGVEPTVQDSSVVENRKFKFSRPAPETPTLAFITMIDSQKGANISFPFIYEKGSIEIVVDSAYNLLITGTELNNKLNDFTKDSRAIDSEMMKLNQRAEQGSEEMDSIQSLAAQMQVFQTKYDDLVRNFVKANIKNKAGEYVFASRVPMSQTALVEELLAEANPEFVAAIKKGAPAPESEETETSFVGQKFIDVVGQTPDDKKIALSDYVGKGKVVLIDFWASWCGPCIKEMPNVVAAYNKYKAKGFEIVGISLDDDKAKWADAIKKYKMNWIHISDLKKWDSQLSAAYSVASIPFTLLVDPNGIIIAENLRGEELEAALAKYIK